MVCTLLIGSMMVTNAIVTNVEVRLKRSDPRHSLSRFVGYPMGGQKDTFCPNPNFWLKDVDFSCASPWNSDRGRCKAGTLISKRHIIFAKHFPIAVGTRIVFATTDGGVCPCRIAATKAIDKCDIMVGALDYEVTPNVHPAKILPVDYERWIGDGAGLPAVTLTQHEKAYVNDLMEISTNVHWRNLSCRTPSYSLRAKFRDELITGDSGSPVFLIAGNEPILLYCVKMGGAGLGPAIHRYRTEIQQAMDDLCPGYKLEAFDFAALERK